MQTELETATPVKRYIKSEPPAYKTTPMTSTSSGVIYEMSTPPPPPSIEKGDDDDDDDDVDPEVEPHVLEYGATTLGELNRPYVPPYLYESNRRVPDTEYGIRRVGDEFMIGDSQVSVDRDGNIHIKEVEFSATNGLWELLTRRKVNKRLVTSNDLKQYKTILEMNNAHLEGYDPDANIRTSKSLKFRDVISKLFSSGTRQSGVEAALRREWVSY